MAGFDGYMAGFDENLRIYSRSLLLSLRDDSRSTGDHNRIKVLSMPPETRRAQSESIHAKPLHAEVTEMLPIESDTWHHMKTLLEANIHEMSHAFGVKITKHIGLRGRHYLKILGNECGVNKALVAFQDLLVLPDAHSADEMAFQDLLHCRIDEFTPPPGLQPVFSRHGEFNAGFEVSAHKVFQEDFAPRSCSEHQPAKEQDEASTREDGCQSHSISQTASPEVDLPPISSDQIVPIGAWEAAVAAVVNVEKGSLGNCWICSTCSKTNMLRCKVCSCRNAAPTTLRQHWSIKKSNPASNLARKNKIVELANPLPLAGKTLPPPRILTAGLVVSGSSSKNSARNAKWNHRPVEKLGTSQEDVVDPSLACYVWNRNLKRPMAQRRGGC
jgi:hypothetical protein